ncbi:MAG TPA: glycosyltransferase, partial [Anaerolineaceae bacterium]
MRILYFTRADTPHDRRFLTALAGSGHEIWALRLERASVRAEVPAGVKTAVWEGIPAPADLEEALAAAPALAEVIAAVQPDLIHAGPVQLAAAAAARVGFHPLLAMSWGSDLLVDAGRDESWRAATLEALRGADWLACDNLAVAEKAAALGFPGERITRFAWGVNLAHFSPGGGEAVRERLDWQQAFILLSLRAWEPLYGVDVAARAFVRAAHRRPDLRLIL